MSEIRVDTISEKTSANGVSIDGLTIKDGGIKGTGAQSLVVGSTDGTSARLVLDATNGDASGGDFPVLTADGTSLSIVANNSGGDAFITFQTNSGEDMRIDPNGNVGIGTPSPSTNLHIKSTADNAPHLLLENFQDADTDDAAVIELYLNDQTTGGIGDNTDVGVIRFTGDEKDGGTKETYAEIRGVAHDPGQGTGNRGHLSLFVQSAGSLAETMTLDESQVGIGTNAPAKTLHISSADNQPLRVESTDAYSGVELKDNGASTLPPLISGLSDGFKIYAGHGSSRPEVMSIDATGAVTMPLQPAFQLNRQGQGNQTISANSDTTIVLATERFDRNADCASNTFTAPVTGLYKLQAFFYLKDIDTDMNYIQGKITTSNKTYYFIQSTGGYDATMQYVGKNITVLADMDASDTAHIMVYYPSGSDLTVTDETHFSGHLVC